MLNWFKIVLIVGLLGLFTGCESHDKNALRVGTIAGPDAELIQAAAQVAQQQYGLSIEVVEFTDYLQPNAALNDKSIDANMFQHQPFLEQQIKEHHYALMTLGKTFVFPMGIYSTKIKNIQEIPVAALVGIPNDASNEGRALLLLQKTGLIQLKKSAGIYATPADVVKNDKQLVFKELDAAQLARSLPDVTIAIINTNYAIPAGLSPAEAIYHEDKNSPYANIVVIRAEDRSDPRLQQLVQAIHSEAVLKLANTIFNGYAIPVWRK